MPTVSKEKKNCSLPLNNYGLNFLFKIFLYKNVLDFSYFYEYMKDSKLQEKPAALQKRKCSLSGSVPDLDPDP